jgi:hypothetical protein
VGSQAINLILFLIFVGEMVIRMIALTPWVFGDHTSEGEPDTEGELKPYAGYFQDNWNVLDFLIVCVGGLNYVPGVANMTVFRTFRILRPLRTLNKIPGLKSIVVTLLDSLEDLWNVSVLTAFIFFVFAVLGMELFQGMGAFRCVDVSNYDPVTASDAWSVLPDDANAPIEDRHCGGSYTCPEGYKCYAAGRAKGKVKFQNMNDGITGYDNIGQAILTVFVSVTLEGWVDVMYLYQDTYNYYVSSIYHLFMILLGSCFCFQLALAVIADNFPVDEEEMTVDPITGEPLQKDEVTGELVYDHEDEPGSPGSPYNADGSLDLAKEMELKEAQFGPRPSPRSPVQLWCWRMTANPRFEKFILCCIVVNTVCLACDHVRTQCVPLEGGGCVDQAVEMDKEFKNTLEVLNYIFLGVFTAEMIIKMIGLGFTNPKTNSRADWFNLFDGTIVILGFIEAAVNLKGFTALRLFRLARVLRTFKLGRTWPTLTNIIASLLHVLPKISSMGILLLLYMFISAIAGMQLVGETIPADSRARFDAFWVAMLTIFQFLTGENWNEAMFEGMKLSGRSYISLYYIIVELLGIFIILNLFLELLLSGFNAG